MRHPGDAYSVNLNIFDIFKVARSWLINHTRTMKYPLVINSGKIFQLAVCLIAFLPVCLGQGVPEEVQNNIDLRVENALNPGIVVGIIDETGTHYYSSGLKAIQGIDKVDEHTVFEIGSISKTFTGILLAEMVLKKEVKLDDPLQQYLPPGVTAPTRNGQSIQLANLSNHSSALPRLPDNFSPADPSNPYVDYSEEQLYDFLNSYILTRDIGSRYEYSNYAVGLLGHILAAKRKTNYEALMVDVIAKPLKMDHTRVTLTPEMRKNLAKGHSGGIEVRNWDLITLAGAGGIRSTAVDMVKYVSANMGKAISGLYPAMQLSHTNSGGTSDGPVVGLGWHIRAFGDTFIIWHNGGTGGYRSFAGFIKGGDKGVVVLTNSDMGVDDIGIHLLHAESPLNTPLPSIGVAVRKILDEQGISAAEAAYWNLREKELGKFDFTEPQLNNLGYNYLAVDSIDKALAVFRLNVKAYPKSSNVYDSYGEAFLASGDTLQAIENYRRSVEINPGNTSGIEVLEKLGEDTDKLVSAVEVAAERLESYVGQYQLAPDFILTVTKEATQLKAQATGQPQFDIFPKTENVFYLKVVEAQLTFNVDEQGTVISVTLFQNGQEMVGKRLQY